MWQKFLTALNQFLNKIKLNRGGASEAKKLYAISDYDRSFLTIPDDISMFGLFVDIDDKGKIGLYQKGEYADLESDTFLKLTEREYEQVKRLLKLGLSKKDIYYVFDDSVVTLTMSKEDQKKLEELRNECAIRINRLLGYIDDGAYKEWAEERRITQTLAFKEVITSIYNKYLGGEISLDAVNVAIWEKNNDIRRTS